MGSNTIPMQLMSDLQMREVSAAVLTSMTEAEFANWQRQQGAHVVQHRGRYWQEVQPGFYQPIHWLARLSGEQATCPRQLHWGWRGTLCADDSALANSSMPVHLLTDVEGYDLQSLPPTRRRHIRKCRKLITIVELTSPALLQEQGYEVLSSAVARTGYGKLPSRKDYLAGLANCITPGRLVIAGLIGDKLGGYFTGYAVSGTAYMENTVIATEALSTDISSGLQFEFVQVCRRGKIREIVSGQHSREDPGLCTFKEEMGFPVKHIPALVRMNSVIEIFIRCRRPHVYYRLTGYNTSIKNELPSN